MFRIAVLEAKKEKKQKLYTKERISDERVCVCVCVCTQHLNNRFSNGKHILQII